MTSVYGLLNREARAWWANDTRAKQRRQIRESARTWRQIVTSGGSVVVAHTGDAFSASYCATCATPSEMGTGCSMSGCGPEIVEIAKRLGVPVLRFDKLTREQAVEEAIRGPMIGCACDMRRQEESAFGRALKGTGLGYVTLTEKLERMRALNPAAVE